MREKIEIFGICARWIEQGKLELARGILQCAQEQEDREWLTDWQKENPPIFQGFSAEDIASIKHSEFEEKGE